MTDLAFAAEPLDLRWIDGKNWRVTDEFDYTARNGRVVIVPAGFETDFASIPKVLWNVLPPTGKYGKAAVLHDFMYRHGIWTPDGPDCTKADADTVIHDAMRDLKVPGWQVWAVYGGVRVGGFVTWNKYRKDSDA